MDERTKKKHLDAIRYGLKYFEGHIEKALKDKASPAAIMHNMIAAVSALGAMAIEREAYAAGVNKRELLDARQATSNKAATAYGDVTNNEFEPQLASGWDFPNIGRGVKEAA